MSTWKCMGLAGAVALALFVIPEVSAKTYSSRQYYSSWKKFPQGNNYYRNYYYKPTPDYAGYKHHYAVYSPEKPDYVYYYNPYKKTYWGRCPAHAAGKPQYALLQEEDRKAVLEEIPEEAFPKMGRLPPIPESNPGEDVTLDLPPDDLPTLADGLPRVKASS